MSARPRATTARSDSGSAPTTVNTALVPSREQRSAALAFPDDMGVGQQEPVSGEHDGGAEALPARAAASLRYAEAGDLRREFGGDPGDDL